MNLSSLRKINEDINHTHDFIPRKPSVSGEDRSKLILKDTIQNLKASKNLIAKRVQYISSQRKNYKNIGQHLLNDGIKINKYKNQSFSVRKSSESKDHDMNRPSSTYNSINDNILF